MKLLRIKMLKSRDQLFAGQFYNLPEATALSLMERGWAVKPDENQIVGPSETKPTAPSELKEKKKPNRARTAKES